MPTIDPLVAEVRLQTNTLKSQFDQVGQMVEDFKRKTDEAFKSFGSGGGGGKAFDGIKESAREANGEVSSFIKKLQLMVEVSTEGVRSGSNLAKTMSELRIELNGLRAGEAADEAKQLTRAFEENTVALKKNTEAEAQAARDDKLVEKLRQTEQALRTSAGLGHTYAQGMEEVKVALSGLGVAQKSTREVEELTAAIQNNIRALKEEDAAIEQVARENKLVQKLQTTKDSLEKSARAGLTFAEGMKEAQAALSGLGAGGASQKVQDLTKAIQKNEAQLRKNTEAEQQEARDKQLIEKLKLTEQALQRAVKEGKTYAQALGEVKVAESGIGARPQNVGEIQRLSRSVADSTEILKENGKQINGFFENIRANLGRIATFTLASGIFIRGFFAIQNALVDIVKSGIEFNSFLEQAKFGIAALLTNSRELVSATGEIATQAQAYPLFLEKAKKFQKEIQILDAQTLGTGEELLNVFERVLAFSQNQVATDKERLQLAANILNASKLLGLQGEQVATETRQILTLERDQGQQILQTLGLRARELRAYRDQGTLVQKLNDLLKVYSIIATDVGLSFEGLVTTAQTFFSILKAQSFEGTFGGLKDVLKGAGEELKKISESGGASSALNVSSEDLKRLGANLADIAASVTKFLADATNGFIQFAAKAENGLRVFKPLLGGIADGLTGVLRLFGEIISSVDRLISLLPNIKLPEAVTQGFGGTGSVLSAALRGGITGGILGGAAGAPFGVAPATATVAAITTAALAAKAEGDRVREAQGALDKFVTEGKDKLVVLDATIRNIGNNINTRPEFFQVFLKYIPTVQVEIDKLKNQILTLPEGPVRDEAIEKVKKLQDGIDLLVGSLERMKGGVQAIFSAPTLKTIENFTKQITDARQELELQQRISAAFRGVAARSGTSNEFEQIKAQLDAEQKILAQTEEFNRARDEQISKSFDIHQATPPAPISEENLKLLQAGKLEFVQIIPNVQALAKEMGQLAIATTIQTQGQAESTQATQDKEKAVEKLKEALKSLTAETESANISFAKTIASFNQDEAAAAQARDDAITASLTKKLGDLAEKFGDQSKIPAEAIAQLNKLEQAERRKGLAETIKEEEKFSNERIARAEQTAKRVADAKNAEIEAQKILGQTELDNLTFQQKQAEENAGIAGRANNTLRDRIRLVNEVAQAEKALAAADIEKERVQLEKLRKDNDTLVAEIARLEANRQDKINSLQIVDTIGTPEERAGRLASVTKHDDDELAKFQGNIKTNEGLIKGTENTIASLGAKITRVTTQAASDINKLSTTVVHLNDPIANFLTNIVDGIGKGTLKLKDVFKTLKDDITSAFSNAFRESIKKKLEFDFEFKDNIGGLGDFFKNTFSGAFNFVSGLFGGGGGGGGGGIGGFFSNLLGGSKGGLPPPDFVPGVQTPGGGGFLSSLFGGNTGGGFLSKIFGGGAGSGGGGGVAGVPDSFVGPGIFGGGVTGTNIFGGTGAVSTFPPGTPLGDILGAGGGAGTGPFPGGAGGIGKGGFGANLGAGLLGNAGANILKGLVGFGGSKQAQLGGNIGGTVGGVIGSIWGPVGTAIGSFIGNLLGSAIGSLFAPGRIAAEKSAIQKQIGKVLPDLPTKVVKETEAAAGLKNLKDVNPALLALGGQFASTAKGATQGTQVRYAAQLAADLTRAGKNAKSSQADILKLAESLGLDLASGVSSINKLMGENVLSFKTFNKEIADSRKNLSKYGDTSHLTVKELNDLAVANGNTGSRIATVGETLAGVIDIATGFDSAVNGSAIASSYLADSFDKVAHEGNVFNDSLKNTEEQIRSGKLSLEEGIVALNEFRKAAGLAAVDLSKFSIDAAAIQKQIDNIKTAVDTIKTAFKNAIQAGIQGAKREDIEKQFRLTVYQALVDNIVNGMVDGFIKAAAASGPITQALASIGDLVTKFVGGELSQADFFSQVHDLLAATEPIIAKIAEAAGITADEFRKMLGTLPGFKDLLGAAKGDIQSFTDAITSAASGALQAGVEQGANSEAIKAAFRHDFYKSFASIVEGAMIDGIIHAALETGPLKAALEKIGTDIADFATGKISIQQFITTVKGTLDAIGPVIDAIAEATGIAAENIKSILSEKGIVIDVSTSGLAQSILDAAKGAVSAGIQQGLSSSEIATAFKGDFYTAFANTVSDAMITGVVNAALATGPIKEALNTIGTAISDVASGKMGIEEFTGAVGATLDKIKPVIDAIAEAVGITAAKLEGLLQAKGITLNLQSGGFNFKNSLRDASSQAIIDGIVAGSSSAEVATAIRRTLYKSILESVAQAFLQGIVNAALSAGPLKAATEGFSKAFADFSSNKTNEAQFADQLRATFAEAIPFIKRFSDSLGGSSGIISDFFKELGILPDILGDTATAAADLAHNLRQAAKDLLLDNALSPLKPKERVAQAEKSFEELRARALGGDKEAAKLLPEAGKKLLEEARKVFASSTAYEKIFDFVRASLLDVATAIDPVVAVGDEQLRTLMEIRDELKTFGDKLFKTLDTQTQFNGILTGAFAQPPPTTTPGTATGAGTPTGMGANTPSVTTSPGNRGYGDILPPGFSYGGNVAYGIQADYSPWGPQATKDLIKYSSQYNYGPLAYSNYGSKQAAEAYANGTTTPGGPAAQAPPETYANTGPLGSLATPAGAPASGTAPTPASYPYGNDYIAATPAPAGSSGQPYGNDYLNPPPPASSGGSISLTDFLNALKPGSVTSLQEGGIVSAKQTLAILHGSEAVIPLTTVGANAANLLKALYGMNEHLVNIELSNKTIAANTQMPTAATSPVSMVPAAMPIPGTSPTGNRLQLPFDLKNPHPLPSSDVSVTGSSAGLPPGFAYGQNVAYGIQADYSPWGRQATKDLIKYSSQYNYGPLAYSSFGSKQAAEAYAYGGTGGSGTSGAGSITDFAHSFKPGSITGGYVSLASGGIVTGKEVLAALHGLEAVVPLGTAGANAAHLLMSSPSIEKELQGVNQHLANIESSNQAIVAHTQASTALPTPMAASATNKLQIPSYFDLKNPHPLASSDVTVTGSSAGLPAGFAFGQNVAYGIQADYSPWGPQATKDLINYSHQYNYGPLAYSNFGSKTAAEAYAGGTGNMQTLGSIGGLASQYKPGSIGSVSLAEGGIVTAPVVNATLHGPEAVIPLSGAGAIEVNAPDILKTMKLFVDAAGNIHMAIEEVAKEVPQVVNLLTDVKDAGKSAVSLLGTISTSGKSAAENTKQIVGMWDAHPTQTAAIAGDTAGGLPPGFAYGKNVASGIQADYSPWGPQATKDLIKYSSQYNYGANAYSNFGSREAAEKYAGGDTKVRGLARAGLGYENTALPQGFSYGGNVAYGIQADYSPWGPQATKDLIKYSSQYNYGPLAYSNFGSRQAAEAYAYGTEKPKAGQYVANGTTGYQSFGMAMGGIVTAKEMPAMLHGPEAVIPLPMSGGHIEVSVPDLLDEIRELRHELMDQKGKPPLTANISIDGNVNIGAEKMGKFVIEKTQVAFDKDQLRVPKKAVRG